MKITFVLDKQTIRRTDSNTVVAGSRDYLYAHFALASPDWIAPITAIFGNKTVILNDDGDCKVPWEVIEHPGAFSVSAFCVSVHTAQGVMVPVEETPYDPGETPPDPSPDVYTQLTQMVQEALDTASSVREDANAGEFNGAPGPVGPYYEPDVNDAGDISWENNGGLPNPPTKNIKGPKGDAATIEIAGTETGNPGTDASVVNEGTKGDAKFRFTIPRGDEGKAATIEVGEVTASDPGSEPQVTNTGTENAAVFDFVLPRGQTGPTGQAATVEVESTITGQPGTQASVENVGTSGAAKLRFTIPQGAQGVQGNPGVDAPNPQITVKETSTLPAGSPATVEVEGESPNFELSFGIPQGPQGAQGIQGKQGIQGEQGIQGPVGPTGATPNITMQVTALEYDQEPTVSKSGTPEDPVFTLGIPQGQPGKDGVQINDEAVNTTETWSSKKLLDTLCPPFTETGNPITCNPVEDYPLDVTVTMEPIQEGTGDPSPDNVRPITGRNNVKITVSNEDESHDYTLTLPETIYGGEVDAGSGVGSNEVDVIELAVADMDNNTDSFPGWMNQDWIGNYVENTDQDTEFSIAADYVASNADGAKGLRFAPSGVVYFQEMDFGLTQSQLKERYPDLVFQFAFRRLSHEPFQATGNQPIPALAGENTVYTDAETLTVSGRTDPLSTIQTMQAQITALQDQATQGGTA